MARLGDLVTISSSSEKLKCDTFWLLNLDMVEQQTGNIIEYNYVSKDQLNGSIIQFDADVVLYSKLRPNLNKVVLPEQAGFATSEMLPLRPDSSKLLREYLAVYLRSDSFVTWAVSKTAGAKMPRLGTKELLGKEFSLPSLCEQRKIVSEFQKINKLIFLRKQQLSKLDELVKSRFIEMFGDSEHNTMNWPTAKLSTLCDVGSSKRIYQSELTENGIPFLRISDLNERIDGEYNEPQLFIPNKRFDELKTNGLVPSAGDILVTARGTLGRCYIVKTEDKFYFQDGMISWLSDISENITSLYISELFATAGVQKQIANLQAGSTVAYLSIAMLKKLDIMIPPKALQQQFETFVEQVDKSKSEIQKSLDQLETLKKSLMQKYFG